MSSQEIESDLILNNIIYYYEVRITALVNYSDRVWNRFNWFLTLHLAIFGFFLSQIEKTATQPLLAYGVPVVGAIVAVIWALMGAEDFVSMRRHGARANIIENKLKEIFLKNGFDFNVSVFKSFLNFRQTWLLFGFPIFVFIIWLGVFYFKNQSPTHIREYGNSWAPMDFQQQPNPTGGDISLV